MRLVIIGGGNIGLNLAKMLETNFEDVRVKIIEKNKSRDHTENILSRNNQAIKIKNGKEV